MYKKYSGFKVLNLETGSEKIYPYIKGENSQDTENRALKEQMELTGTKRFDFTISELISK